MPEIIVKVERCNSIESAMVHIKEKALNIKFGANGIGKSTIANSIIAKSADDGSLKDLTAFKYLKDEAKRPSVEGVEGLKLVLKFDEDFVDQFLFQEDELIKNSYDVFIRNV